MLKRILVGGLAFGLLAVTLPLAAAFEAHVINVSATIENALFVHPQSIRYGTVFPQEHLLSSFFITFSDSFSADDQNRVGTVEYVIKQKPKPRPERVVTLGGADAARAWCELNHPVQAGNLSDPYYLNCFPSICPYLSKHPDNHPATGPNANNDVGLPPFHDPETKWATGRMVKFDAHGTTVGNDPSDTWDIDLAVPCFAGQCAQDWENFVTSLNPTVTNPTAYQLPASLEHQVFGCDLWVEVSAIH